MTPLIVGDIYDPMSRKVARFEMELDNQSVMLDLPKRYAGHATGQTRFTEPHSVRYLDKESVLFLIGWLTEAAALLPEPKHV